MDNLKIFYNGKIYNGLKKEDKFYDYLIIERGKIKKIGKGEGYKDYLKTGEMIDLKKKLVLPAFIDSHVHFTQTGLEETYINARNITSLEQLFQKIKEEAKNKQENEWIVASNFNERNFNEKRYPLISELDNLGISNPIMIIRADAHACILNSKAFKLLGIDETINGVKKNYNDEVVGLLVAEANNQARISFSNLISDELRLKAHKIAAKIALKNGITFLNALEGGGGLFSDKDVDALQKNKKLLPIFIRIYQQSMDVENVVKRGFKQIGGCITLDGSIGSHTAAMNEPYIDEEKNCGILYYDNNVLEKFVDKANRADLQITTHCIGDAAIDQILDAYTEALKKYPRKDHRHRIEHFSVPTYEQIDKVAKLNIIVSTQPSFDYYNTSNLYEERLGQERANRAFPLRTMTDKGIIIAGGSDSPITIMSPLLGIHSAVNMRNEKQRLSLKEAIELFTINGAYASFEEKNRGTLEVGKLGDFVVLEDDIFEISPDTIKDVNILSTFIEGKKMY